MQERKAVPTAERASLLETFLTVDFSLNTEEKISEAIKNTCLKSGSEVAEAKAKEIRLLIESGMSESEILEALKTM